MSKSFKDQANYYRHHPEAPVPAQYKLLVEVMTKHVKGDRLGNQRKAQARLKTVERRNERAKAKQVLKTRIQRDYP